MLSTAAIKPPARMLSRAMLLRPPFRQAFASAQKWHLHGQARGQQHHLGSSSRFMQDSSAEAEAVASPGQPSSSPPPGKPEKPWDGKIKRIVARREARTGPSERLLENTGPEGSSIPPRIVDTSAFASLRVNATRMMEELHQTCQWGAGRTGTLGGPVQTGMSRLALSDADKQVRNWFVDTTRALGCAVTVDAMGNIFAVRPGKEPGPPTMAGSHLDTQPTGGRYAGILGVMAGVEMLRVLHENNVQTEFPVGVVNWSSKEAARFSRPMIGSAVWAGRERLEQAHQLQEVGGTATVKSELERIGYLGDTPASYEAMPIAAHFELYIDQANRLPAMGNKIGVVTSAKTWRWYTIDVYGREGHAATTSMSPDGSNPNRFDALVAASQMIHRTRTVAAQSQKWAQIKEDGGTVRMRDMTATVGKLTISPGTADTIPSHVRFTLIMYASNNAFLNTLERNLRIAYGDAAVPIGADWSKPRAARAWADAEMSNMKVSKKPGSNKKGNGPSETSGSQGSMPRPCQMKWTLELFSPLAQFDKTCQRAIWASAALVMNSGDPNGQARNVYRARITRASAGYDSINTTHRCPTAMIQVPCKDGLSHHPDEFASDEDCVRGADVLMQSVLWYDAWRAGEEGTSAEAGPERQPMDNGEGQDGNEQEEKVEEARADENRVDG